MVPIMFFKYFHCFCYKKEVTNIEKKEEDLENMNVRVIESFSSNDSTLCDRSKIINTV